MGICYSRYSKGSKSDFFDFFRVTLILLLESLFEPTWVQNFMFNYFLYPDSFCFQMEVHWYFVLFYLSFAAVIVPGFLGIYASSEEKIVTIVGNFIYHLSEISTTLGWFLQVTSIRKS